MRKFLAIAFVAVLCGIAVGAGLSFTLKPDAGVQGAVVGITQAKFPPPGVARDPIVHPYITFSAVDFDMVGASPAIPGTATTQPVPAVLGVKTWKSWNRTVRADVIVGTEEGQDEYAGYVAVYTFCPLDMKSAAVIEGDVFYVRGEKKTIDAILAQTTGTKVIAATFDETR